MVEAQVYSGIPDLTTAAELCRQAGPDVALMVDSWHFFRGVPDFEALRAVPGGRIMGIQLNDAPRQPGADLLVESMDARQSMIAMR